MEGGSVVGLDWPGGVGGGREGHGPAGEGDKDRLLAQSLQANPAKGSRMAPTGQGGHGRNVTGSVFA